jgi:hypothetical protein
MQRTQQNKALQVAANRAIALLAYQSKTYVELFEQYNVRDTWQTPLRHRTGAAQGVRAWLDVLWDVVQGCKLVCESVICFSDDEEVMGPALEAIISLCHGNTTGTPQPTHMPRSEG